MKRIQDLFRGDGLNVSSSVFPDINTDRIASDLGLKQAGLERGRKNLPTKDEATLDNRELGAVERVEEIRRKGLENYDENRRVYARRLARASAAKSEINNIAENARSQFMSLVKSYRARMALPLDHARNWSEAITKFQKKHQLDRPAYDAPSTVSTVAILVVCFILETVLNSYLFAARNEMGYLGGFFAAALVSVVNIGLAIIAGLFVRQMVHKSWLRKIAGLVVLIAWIGLAGALGFGTAHFRDALEAGLEWRAAAKTGVANMIAAPLELAGFESWLLLAWGTLTALAVVLKYTMTGEPYPGYGRVTENFKSAAADYEHELDQALGHLEAERDRHIQELTDAGSVVRDEITDAIDAIYGQRMMRQNLRVFLEQCDIKASRLLKIYRDANTEAREEPAPDYFGEGYKFEKFEPQEIENTEARSEAETHVGEIDKIIEASVKKIHAAYREYMENYPALDAIVGIDMVNGPVHARARDAEQPIPLKNPIREAV